MKTKKINSALKFLFGISIFMLIGFACLQNPFSFTISHIGLERPIAFRLLCLLLCVSSVLGQLRLFGLPESAEGFTELVSLAVNLPIITVSFTSSETGDPIMTAAHWISALIFICGNPLLILHNAIGRIKRGERKPMIVLKVFLPLYIADGLYAAVSILSNGAVLGKNGVMEIIPICMTYALFSALDISPAIDYNSNNKKEVSDCEYNLRKTEDCRR